MAKKSAASKGYRKQTVKKPYLSKRDITILCVVVALLAVGAFFLFRYDDGALKVRDGAVVAEGDNWLIVDGSNVRGRSRYFKVGEMGEMEGWQREKTATISDANVPEYVFTADAADAAIDRVTVTCAHNGPDALAKYTQVALANMEHTEAGEVQNAELADRAVTWYSYTVDNAEAEAEALPEDYVEHQEAEPTADADAEDAPRFAKTLSGYFDAAHDSSFIIHVESHAETAEACPTDEAMTEVLAQVVAAVTPVEAK